MTTSDDKQEVTVTHNEIKQEEKPDEPALDEDPLAAAIAEIVKQDS